MVHLQNHIRKDLLVRGQTSKQKGHVTVRRPPGARSTVEYPVTRPPHEHVPSDARHHKPEATGVVKAPTQSRYIIQRTWLSRGFDCLTMRIQAHMGLPSCTARSAHGVSLPLHTTLSQAHLLFTQDRNTADTNPGVASAPFCLHTSTSR